MPIGLYISVPFCKSKCSYCNFASGVFSADKMAAYVDRLTADMAAAQDQAQQLGAGFERSADSLYLGGGTPTLLGPELLDRLFTAACAGFDLAPDAEITVECAPGTLTPELLEVFRRHRVNRVSLGVQSFVDKEAASVARLHTRETTLADIERLRGAGIDDINLDLIAGLPHQTPESWTCSLREAIATGVPHVSVYILEVDEDSRLGRELLAGGQRYHAHHVPDDNATADFYLQAVAELNAAGIAQYEISNFARAGRESRHNLKYWTREPYFGFGVDAHSMLRAADVKFDAVRFATSDSLDSYMAGERGSATRVSIPAALEESFFLGLRLNRGVDYQELAGIFGVGPVYAFAPTLAELENEGLLAQEGTRFRLTDRGRLLSNEVFQRFIGAAPEIPVEEFSGPPKPQLVQLG